MGYRNKKQIIFLPIAIAVAIVAGFALGLLMNKKDQVNYKEISPISSQSSDVYNSQMKLRSIIDLVNKYYVDNINIDSLTESFIPQMLEKLDPHSMYIPAKDVSDVNEDLEGQFDGIGVMFNMLTDTVIIQDVISGGPSEKAGLLDGDRIINIDDSLIAGKKMDQNKVVKKLKGKGGTVVKLGIERSGQEDLINIDVTRGKIPIKSIDAAFMIEPGIGYVKLLRFSRFSHKELVKAIDDLKNQGMKTLILDLKGNPGGFLDQAIMITQEFLDKDKLIVYTEGEKSKKSMQFSDGSGHFLNEELVVLIDEGSASSSEIVAGAIQDNDRGTIIGRRSFGKGLVQQQIPFRDGSVVNLTIARYYTPTGRCIQRPYDKGIKEYQKDLYNRYMHSELISKDSIKLPDSLKFTTPKGKVVYGGGGIMPDIFVPMDTSMSNFARELMTNNKLFRFIFDYNNSHREELKAIKSFDEATAYFDKNIETIYKNLVSHAKANNIDVSGANDPKTRKYAMTYIKANIARNTGLDDNGFYFFIQPVNEVLTESIKHIKNRN